MTAVNAEPAAAGNTDGHLAQAWKHGNFTSPTSRWRTRLEFSPNFHPKLKTAKYLFILLYCVWLHPRRATGSLCSPHLDEAVIYQETKTHSSP